MLARLLSTLVFAAAAPAADSVIEEIVCKVNGDVITKSDLSQAPDLGERIDQLLLLQRARELNLNADAEVTRRIAGIQADNNLADADKLREFVQQQTGMTVEDFRQKLKEQVLFARVVGDEVHRTIVVSNAEKRAYYDEHKREFIYKDEVYLRQLFVAGTTEAAAKKARELAARARAGEPFGSLARRYSDDAETARTDGLMPSYGRGELRPEVEQIVFAQKRGHVTDPIRTPAGFLVLKIEERHEPGQAPFDDVEEEIAQRLAEPRAAVKFRQVLTKLRERAFLQIRDGYVDSGAAPGKDTSWRDAPQLAPATVTKEELQARRKKKVVR